MIKSTVISIFTFAIISCSSSNNENINNTNKSKIVEIESCVARVSSARRTETMALHLLVKFKTNVDTLTYVKLRVSMVDKYDKKWFDETVIIRDIDCDFSKLCSIDYSISYTENSHVLYSSKYGQDIETFNLILMNATEFEYFRKDSLYKGEVVNYLHNGGTGYDRILIPDAKFEVIDFK